MFILVHSALLLIDATSEYIYIYIYIYIFFFKKILVNVKMNIKMNKCYWYMLTNIDEWDLIVKFY